MKIYTDEEISKKIHNKKIRRNVLNAIIYPIVIIILICNIILMIQKMYKPNEIPNVLGYKMFIIVSGSMEPDLNIGDIAVVQKTSEENLQKGDIITFSESDYQVTHRIVDIIKDENEISYQTKGDANTANDSGTVKFENVEGKYVFKIPKIGLMILGIQNINVMAGLVFIIYIIYCISSEKEDRKKARREKRKEFDKKNEEE